MKGEGTEPAILFVEVPNFYAEVERRAAPALGDRALVVGGDPDKRGKVQSASPGARRSGVEDGMPMDAALELCPGALRVATNMKLYREASGALVTYLRGVFAEVETPRLGCVFAEIRGGASTLDALAGDLVARTSSELSLPLRIGIAPSKFLARLAAEEAGEGGVFRLRGADVDDFLAPLRVSRLPKVGKKMAGRLGELGAETVGDLLGLGADLLEREFSNRGRAIFELARGHDRSPVRVAPTPRSMGRETTFTELSRDPALLAESLGRLSTSLASALERQGFRAARVALRLFRSDGRVTTRSLTPGESFAGADEIARIGRELLERGGDSGELYRGMGVTLGGLSLEGGDDRQLDLFPD